MRLIMARRVYVRATYKVLENKRWLERLNDIVCKCDCLLLRHLVPFLILIPYIIGALPQLNIGVLSLIVVHLFEASFNITINLHLA